MEYVVEDVSPVQKSVKVTVGPEEVNASLAGSVALAQSEAQMPGFRKGKIPADVVEKKFRDHIYKEARENLINVHINEIFEKTGLKPLGGLNIRGDEKPLEKDKEYVYSIDFEVLPEFETPRYEGLSVEEVKAEVKPENLEKLYERMRRDRAKIKPVEGAAPPRDGQIANVDFEFFDGGEPIKDLKVADFNLELGKGEALPDFEKLVKGIPAGNTGEGEIEFPADFIDPRLAGKKVTARVKVRAVKERELPPLDDEFAKSVGMENLEKLKELITKSYLENAKKLNRGAAQRKLLDSMLKTVDFPLPPSMVAMQIRLLLAELAANLEASGRGLEALGKTKEALYEDYRPQAEDIVRSQILLLAIAKKEDLEVSDQELARNIYEDCLRKGDDFKTVFENLERTGMLFHVRDRLLADKAMDLVYAKADVKEVEEPSGDEAEKKPDQQG